jgi:hypothetical protein
VAAALGVVWLLALLYFVAVLRRTFRDAGHLTPRVASSPVPGCRRCPSCQGGAPYRTNDLDRADTSVAEDGVGEEAAQSFRKRAALILHRGSSSPVARHPQVTRFGPGALRRTIA